MWNILLTSKLQTFNSKIVQCICVGVWEGIIGGKSHPFLKSNWEKSDKYYYILLRKQKFPGLYEASQTEISSEYFLKINDTNALT